MFFKKWTLEFAHVSVPQQHSYLCVVFSLMFLGAISAWYLSRTENHKTHETWKMTLFVTSRAPVECAIAAYACLCHLMSHSLFDIFAALYARRKMEQTSYIKPLKPLKGGSSLKFLRFWSSRTILKKWLSLSLALNLSCGSPIESIQNMIRLLSPKAAQFDRALRSQLRDTLFFCCFSRHDLKLPVMRQANIASCLKHSETVFCQEYFPAIVEAPFLLAKGLLFYHAMPELWYSSLSLEPRTAHNQAVTGREKPLKQHQTHLYYLALGHFRNSYTPCQEPCLFRQEQTS